MNFNLTRWAIKYHVSVQALQELMVMFGATDDPQKPSMGDRSEPAVQAMARVNASKRGGRLWRNNVGASYMQDGSFVR